jgi:predicted nucleic-acid-binding protein
MRIIVDTNILVRFLMEKDGEQHKIAAHFMDKADEIIIPTHVVCELIWVLSSPGAYRLSSGEMYTALSEFLRREKLVTREDEIEAGMRFLEKGGDFADGVNEYTGRNMAHGRAVFVSFDKKAVRLLTEHGLSAMVPQL